MADKTTIADWDANPNNNDNIAGIPLAEGETYPSHVNNAIRTTMAQVAALKPIGYTAQARTDAEKAIARTNLGVAPDFHAAPAKAAPADADELSLWDTVGNAVKKLTLVNLKTFLSATFASLTGAAFSGPVTSTKFEIPGFFRAQQNGTASIIEMLPNSYWLETNDGTLRWYVAGINTLTIGGSGALSNGELGSFKTYIDAGDTPPAAGAVKAYIVAKAASGAAGYGTVVSGANIILCDFQGANPTGAPTGSWRVMSAVITTSTAGLLVRTA